MKHLRVGSMLMVGVALGLLGAIGAKAAAPAPQTPVIFAPGTISGAQADASPAFAPHGGTVFFMRGGKDGGWSDPLDLGDTVNDAGYAMGSQLGADRHTLYFYSQRAASTHASPAPAWDNGNANIWKIDLAAWLQRHRSAASV